LAVAVGTGPTGRDLSAGVAFDLPALQRSATGEARGPERVAQESSSNPPLLPIRTLR